MRNLKLIPILSILAISLFVSLSFVQSASARPHIGLSCRRQWKRFYYTVWMPTGEAKSSLDWLECVYPIHWWGNPNRPAFPPEDYTIDEVYVCHGDWCVECAVKEGNFRYQWWIFWESEEAAGEPGAKSLKCGFFIFSQGTGDFEDMWAFGKAWVKMLPGQYFPVGYQYHKGLMFGGP